MARAIRRVFIVTLALNIVVAAAKAGYGYASGSIAIGTDAIHAILDGSSNVLALLTLHWSQAPADEGHPYGHRKIEILTALGIGVLIVVGLFELLSAAIRSLVGHAAPPEIGWGGFAIVSATIAINFGVSRYEGARGRALGSPSLCADAQHTGSDLYASIAVLLSFAGVRLGLRWADPLGALLVAGLVGRAAWLVFRETVPTLIDAAVIDADRVAALARQATGVVDVHHVRSRGLKTAVQLDMRITVDPTMTVAAVSEVVLQIEKALKTNFPDLADVTIRAVPAEPPRPPEPLPDPAAPESK